MVIELVISNGTRAARSFDFEITCMISDQIALHLVQLPLLILDMESICGTLNTPQCGKEEALGVTTRI